MANKNVITILVDSVFSECLGSGRTEESSTPFIDKLINEGVFAPNVYSYGPYTDAATKGLYSGRPSLRDYGYYYGLNSSSYNHFRTFSEAGYETYAFYYPYYLIGSKVRKYIDHTVYTSGVEFSAIWLGKYGYYAEKMKANSLSDLERKILIKYTDLLFDCWLNFYRQINKNAESSIIIKDIEPEEKTGFLILNEEYNKYIKDKDQYINQLLCETDHPLIHLNDYVYDKAINVSWIKEKVFKRHRSFFRELNRKEMWLNIKNNRFNLAKCFRDSCYLRNTLTCLLSGHYFKYVAQKPEWQIVASFQKKIDALFQIILNRDNKDKPFYVSLHTEEPHNYVAFFSYDIQNQSLVDEELEYLLPLLHGCGKHFKGNLVYQLSLRYVDLCVKRLVEKLNENGLLENTSIVLMADHGSSYTYNPVRSSVVNNFYKENYKTPFLIWNSDYQSVPGKAFSGLYSAEDIQPSICYSVGICIPNDYKGRIIMTHPEGRTHVITEYMGPGCPDMISRDVWMTGRNSHYCVAYKNSISKEFTLNQPSELYNLIEDPLEMNDISSKFSEIKDKELLDLCHSVEKRFYEIQSETSIFLRGIDSWNSVLV